MTVEHTLSLTPSPPRASRIAPLLIAAAGVAWNGFGITRFLETLRNAPESMARMGMTAEQAASLSYPAWMNAAFAIGVFGGLCGSALLLGRRRLAVPVFAASLAGYLVLYAGDITEGVFAALGVGQVVILTTVVAIAAGLFAYARRLHHRGALR